VTPLLVLVALAAAPPPILGRDVDIDRPTLGSVVSIAGDIVIRAEVTGDVVAVAGDIVIEPGGHVDGDVVALGGTVGGEGGIAGRVVTASLVGGARHGRPVESRFRIALSLLRSGAWILAVTAVVLCAPRFVRRVGSALLTLRWRAMLTGAGALIAWFAAMILALMGGAWSLGKLLVLLGVVGFVVIKLVGLTVVAWAVGRALAHALPAGLRGELPRAGLGALVLTGLTAVPLVGELFWLVANVVGFGAVVSATVRRRHALVPSTDLPPR